MPPKKPTAYVSNIHTFQIETRLTVRGFIWRITRKTKPTKRSDVPEVVPPVVGGNSAPDTDQPVVSSPTNRNQGSTTQPNGVKPPNLRLIAPLLSAATTKAALSTRHRRVGFEPPLSQPIDCMTYTHIYQPETHQKKQDLAIFMTLPVIPAPGPTVWPPATFEGETHLRIIREDNPTFVDRRDLPMQLALRKLLLFGQFDLEGPTRPGNHVWAFRSSDGSTLSGTWYRYLLDDNGKAAKFFLKPVEVSRALVERTDGSASEVSILNLPFKPEKTITLDLSLSRTVSAASRAYRMWNGYFASTEALRPLTADRYYGRTKSPGFRSSVLLIVLRHRSSVPDSHNAKYKEDRPHYLFRLAVEDGSVHDPTEAFKFTVWGDIGVPRPQPAETSGSGSGTTATTSSDSSSRVEKKNPAAGTDNDNPDVSKFALESRLIASGLSSPDGIEIALNLDPELTELGEEQIEWEMGLVYYAMLAMKDKRFKIF